MFQNRKILKMLKFMQMSPNTICTIQKKNSQTRYNLRNWPTEPQEYSNKKKTPARKNKTKRYRIPDKKKIALFKLN